MGSVLVYSRDASISVEVVESRKVDYQGEVVGLSRAAKEILGTDYYVAPTGFWLYEGRSLSEIYDETYPVVGD